MSRGEAEVVTVEEEEEEGEGSDDDLQVKMPEHPVHNTISMYITKINITVLLRYVAIVKENALQCQNRSNGIL